jgi:hypothetical protein
MVGELRLTLASDRWPFKKKRARIPRRSRAEAGSYLCGPWRKDRLGRAMRAEDAEQAMRGTYLLRGPVRGWSKNRVSLRPHSFDTSLREAEAPADWHRVGGGLDLPEEKKRTAAGENAALHSATSRREYHRRKRRIRALKMEILRQRRRAVRLVSSRRVGTTGRLGSAGSPQHHDPDREAQYRTRFCFCKGEGHRFLESSSF